MSRPPPGYVCTWAAGEKMCHLPSRPLFYLGDSVSAQLQHFLAVRARDVGLAPAAIDATFRPFGPPGDPRAPHTDAAVTLLLLVTTAVGV